MSVNDYFLYLRFNHSLSYFALFPLAFSTGYFFAFTLIFSRTISSRSSPKASAIKTQKFTTTASSSHKFSCYHSFEISAQHHMNTSSSSAASNEMEIARSFGLWNCFQALSSLNFSISLIVSSVILVFLFDIFTKVFS